MAAHTKQELHHLVLVMILLASKEAASQTKPNCPTKCGDLNIPYPFGTSEGCYLDDTFLINCNHDSNTPNIPLLGQDNITVLNISLHDGELLLSTPIVHDCYGIKGNSLSPKKERVRGLNLSHFSISPSRNKFTAIGCDTVGIFKGYDKNKNQATTIGCVSICDTIDGITSSNGSCNGTGCCQIDIPNGLFGFVMETWSRNNHTNIHGFDPCNYALAVEKGFSYTNLMDLESKELPLVLDWAVGNQTCQQVQRDGSYACKSKNTDCQDSPNGIGYRCKCQQGFEGNPYLDDHHGCKEVVNECDMGPNPCHKCHQNLHGGFNGPCPNGYEGDGLRNGKGSQRKDKSFGNIILIIGLSLSLSLLALLVGCINIYPQIRETKLTKKREIYFQQNGGILLEQQLGSSHGSRERATIFTAEELKKATNNYDEERVIGKGGHGTVYKGVLSDDRVVAIKKSKISNQSEIEQFINEVVVLSQINHRNVVKLLGCCLDTEVPLLVYEFITNGTLSDHLHVEEGQAHRLSWTTRLRIAAETAEALAYLHSAASTPIIHRDIKTANILLDENLTAKVADFGASKLVPLDQDQLTTLVQGTLGYLDPQYFQTSQLTEKSDVYSFGVVLAELLTSKKALSFLRPETNRNLSMYFVSSMNEGRLHQILDSYIVNDASVEHVIEVANLAKRCLGLKGEDRPTMKEVAMELEGIRAIEKHKLGGSNVSEEETEYFLKISSPTQIADNGEASSGRVSISTMFYNWQNQQTLEPLGDGR